MFHLQFACDDCVDPDNPLRLARRELFGTAGWINGNSGRSGLRAVYHRTAGRPGSAADRVIVACFSSTASRRASGGGCASGISARGARVIRIETVGARGVGPIGARIGVQSVAGSVYSIAVAVRVHSVAIVVSIDSVAGRVRSTAIRSIASRSGAAAYATGSSTRACARPANTCAPGTSTRSTSAAATTSSSASASAASASATRSPARRCQCHRRGDGECDKSRTFHDHSSSCCKKRALRS